MAGSQKVYIYQSTILTDSEFWIRADESNIEAVNPNPTGWAVGDSLAGRPFNMRVRKAVYTGQDFDGGLVTISVPILDRTVGLQDLPATFDVSSGQVGQPEVSVFRRGITQERLLGQPFGQDTGRVDGDRP